ncbi:MAG: rod-binding protein [Desulfatiglans sp.]|jgi:flagellar protein FlgJ|nr:rod-binding protein [Thermodesulfobacteriota bacterium]MEE4354444.1 rod-binding protein [Desulfatiglans sp.]
MTDPISVPDVSWQTLDLTNKMKRAQTSLESAGRPSSGQDDPGVKKACAEMESLFIYYLIKEMRATIPKSDFLGGGKAHEMYTSMLDTHLSRELADKGGIGMSSLLMDRLSAKAVVKTTETGHNE